MDDSTNETESRLRRALAGDEEAIGQLLDLHRNDLNALARRMLDGRLAARIDASDIVQQTMLSACGKIGEFVGTAGPAARRDRHPHGTHAGRRRGAAETGTEGVAGGTREHAGEGRMTKSQSRSADAVIASIMERVDNGEEVDRGEIVARHPEIADELESFFEMEDVVGGMAGPQPDTPPEATPQEAPAPEATAAFDNPPKPAAIQSTGSWGPRLPRSTARGTADDGENGATTNSRPATCSVGTASSERSVRAAWGPSTSPRTR